MKKGLYACLLLLCFGCKNTNEILPNRKLNHISNYHCWPYDVEVYSVDEVKIDSAFYSYPLDSYFPNNPKFKITKWTKYHDTDTTVWAGMDKTLEQCDGDTALFNQVQKGNDVFYAGIYRDFKVKEGTQRIYEQILFFDVLNKEIHIFENINKVY